MKKGLKIILGVIGAVILLFVIDLICIFTINRPLLAIKKDNVYKGLLYDTYLCSEYTVPQIKVKETKFTCSVIKTEEITHKDVEDKINLIIENGPKTSSNPFHYVKASQDIYDELLMHPKVTFEYSIKNLIETKADDGLKSYIEALLCSRINTSFKYDFESSSDYLENYKEYLLKDDVELSEYDIYAKTLLK